MRKYPIFDIGKNHNYFDTVKNKEIILKVAKKCYIPANNLMIELLHKHPEFKISYSLSGVFLEQCEDSCPLLIDSFQELSDTGQVEILSETYHHSLASLQSEQEFKDQIQLHKKKIYELFKQKPAVFRNTELIFNNHLANFVQNLGYKGILAEGADKILDKKSPNFVYSPKTAGKIKLLLRNYRLSDDIAFRFSNRSWKEWPLTVEKYCTWLNNNEEKNNCVNLFMDYETLGEHQWKDSGIFNFIRSLPINILKNSKNNFMTPSELVQNYEAIAELDTHKMVSWADTERDLSAWNGNDMQRSALSSIFKIEKEVKSSNDKELLNDWRKLTTSDHFYYMCTKWFNDGDVHKYFNPYKTPYEAYISYMNIINDLMIRLDMDPLLNLKTFKKKEQAEKKELII